MRVVQERRWKKKKGSGWGGCTRQRKERLWEPWQGSELGAFEKLRNENVRVSPSDALAVKTSISPSSYPQSDVRHAMSAVYYWQPPFLSFLSSTCWSNSDDLPFSEGTTPVIHLRSAPLRRTASLLSVLHPNTTHSPRPFSWRLSGALWLHRSLS